MDKYLGIDISGTKIEIVIGKEKYEIIDKIDFKTDAARGFESFKGKVLTVVQKYN